MKFSPKLYSKFKQCYIPSFLFAPSFQQESKYSQNIKVSKNEIRMYLKEQKVWSTKKKYWKLIFLFRPRSWLARSYIASK